VTSSRSALPPKVVAVGLTVAAIAAAAAAYLAEAHVSLRPWPVLGLWLVSIALLLAGARLAERDEQGTRRKLRLERREVIFLGAVTGTALLVRTIELGTLPDNFSGDEGEMGSVARTVLGGDNRDPFTTGWLGHPTLWFFLQALSLQLFGDTVFGLRMLSALLGAAAVPLVYVFARQAFGRSVAVVAAVLLSVFHFHIHYSRIGLNNIADPDFMLISLAAFLSGLRSGSPFKLAIAGVAAGTAQHFYFGSRLVPLVLVAVVVHQLLVGGARLVRASRYLPLTLLGFWIGYGPGVRVPLYHWNNFNARLAVVGIFQSGWFDERRALGESTLEILARQTSRSMGAYTHVVDRSPNYWPQMPLLDPVTAAFFLLGIGLCIFAWRRAESAAVVAWLAGTIVAGGILIVNTPESPRYVTSAPAVCVVAALAIVRSASGISVAFPPLQRIAPALIGALVIGLAAWNLNFYFREYSPRNSYGFRRTEETTAIGRYLHERGAGSFAYFFGAPWTFLNVGTIRFLAPEVAGIDVLEPLERGQKLPAGPVNRRPLLLFLPARFHELSVARGRYPHGVVRTFLAKVDRKPLFFAYEPRAPRS
jgi:dolichyl-phosphate-mannose-protein mannosyltransferase